MTAGETAIINYDVVNSIVDFVIDKFGDGPFSIRFSKDDIGMFAHAYRIDYDNLLHMIEDRIYNGAIIDLEIPIYAKFKEEADCYVLHVMDSYAVERLNNFKR